MSIDVRYSGVCLCRKLKCLSMSDIQTSADVGNSGVC